MAPLFTLAGTIQDFTGAADPNGIVTITLCNYAPQIPRVGGVSILDQVVVKPTVGGGGAFSITLYGNDVISPGPNITYYSINITSSTGNSFSGAYQFTGSGSFDLSNLTPLNPGFNFPPPTPQVVLLNPAGSQTIAGFPLTLTNSSVFTNSQIMSDNLSVLVNGASTLTELQNVQGLTHFATEALAGAIAIPANATIYQSNAVAGYAVTSSNITNVTGGYFQGRGQIPGYNIWGINPVAIDFPYPGGGGNMTGIEVDTQPQGPASAYNTGGKNVVGIQNNLFAPQAGNFGNGMSFNASQVGNWTNGILINTGALGTNVGNAGGSVLFIQPGAIATASANFPAPKILRVINAYWNGSVGTNTTEYDLKTVIGPGTNPTFDLLELSHTGGPGGLSSTFLIDSNIGLGLAHSDGTSVVLKSVDSPGNNYSVNFPPSAGTVVLKVADVDLTGQTNTINTTTLYSVPANGAGQYRLSWNAKVTTAAATSSTLGAFGFIYTDPDGTVVNESANAIGQVAAGIGQTNTQNTAFALILGMPVLLNCKASTNIQYNMNYASNPANQMAFNLHIKLEYLG